jgi:SAM-dependent methyltransferase
VPAVPAKLEAPVVVIHKSSNLKPQIDPMPGQATLLDDRPTSNIAHVSKSPTKPGGLRRAIRGAVDRLPPPRNDAALRLLRAGRDLVKGRLPGSPFGSGVGPPLVRPPQFTEAEMDGWVLPPLSEGHDVLTKELYDTGATVPRYDIELLETLNKEYETRPIVPSPPSFAAPDRIAVARTRIKWAQQLVEVRGKTTLEIGCSNGYESWILAHNLGCDAYGVDVNARGAWGDLSGDRVHFECADLAVKNPFPANKFDVVLSYVVWEHVTHPRKLLQETFQVLKPGGLAWIRANLYCGPQASHRYREIFFPWPHLLFSEDVIRDWDEKHGRGRKGPAWVNRLTWDNYERYIGEIGFTLRHIQFQEANWDEEFYRRFEDVLGRWPIRDLKRDFFLAVLQKPT